MTMTKGLQVGFGQRIGTPLLNELHGMGVEMVRCDMQPVTTQAEFVWLIDEVAHAQLRPLIIIRPDQAAWVPNDASLDIEILNEPNYANVDPLTYAGYVDAVCRTLNPCHAVWAGVIGNLNHESINWLRGSVRSWPAHVNVSVHRYAPKGGAPTVPQAHFASRAAEVECLKAYIGVRKFGVSEFGYHTGEWTTGWWFWKRRHRLTDDQVLAYAQWEWKFWESQRAEFAIWYQINDGAATGDPIDRFGIRYLNGQWKPVAHSFVL